MVSDLMDIYHSGNHQLNKNTNMNVVSPAIMRTMIPHIGVNQNMQPPICHARVQPGMNNTVMSTMIPTHGGNQSMHASVQPEKNNMSTMIQNHGVNQNMQRQIYTSSVHQQLRSNTMMNTSMMSTSMPVMNMVPTPGFNQNMQPQMGQNFYGQQGGANSYYHYKVPNAEVANVPMQANASTTTFDSSFDQFAFHSQSDVDAYNNSAFIDSPTMASSSYDFSMFYQEGNQ